MITIGITESDTNFHHYAPWVKGEDEDIQVVVLSYTAQNLEDLKKCDGIVLSGGIDSHPKFYHNTRIDYPMGGQFNEARDEFELKVFEYAREHQLPVLGICRGMQMINIALGGDLIQDLEEQGKNNHRRMNEVDGVHDIFVNPGSLFYSVVKTEIGRVNSAHHQALGKIADDLLVSASSEDHMPEAIEYKDKTGKGFLLCVQWHPERLDIRRGNVEFSKNIREAFLQSVINYKQNGHH